MHLAAKALVLVVATLLLAKDFSSAAPAVAPAPAPSGKTSPCMLPNGVQILAPEASGTSTQYYYYYYTYSWSYYSYYYYTYYGRKLLQASAPAPSSAPLCCPTTTTKQGDTVTSLIQGAALPDDAKSFFYTINPNIRNGTDTLPAGSVVTVPCFRITEYYRLAANSQAPAASANG